MTQFRLPSGSMWYYTPCLGFHFLKSVFKWRHHFYYALIYFLFCNCFKMFLSSLFSLCVSSFEVTDHPTRGSLLCPVMNFLINPPQFAIFLCVLPLVRPFSLWNWRFPTGKDQVVCFQSSLVLSSVCLR